MSYILQQETKEKRKKIERKKERTGGTNITRNENVRSKSLRHASGTTSLPPQYMKPLGRSSPPVFMDKNFVFVSRHQLKRFENKTIKNDCKS